jgi:hypothetical protein
MQSNFGNLFKALCESQSDIAEHLPVLAFLATQCDHVTEFGVRTGHSTVAFLHAMEGRRSAQLRSYDLNDAYGVHNSCSPLTSVDWEFTQASTLNIPVIYETDFLFIDTLHTYAHVTQELRLHGDQARKWIGFHDTQTFGKVGEDGGMGIVQAIEDWLAAHNEWRIVYQTKRNNGMMLIERYTAIL